MFSRVLKRWGHYGERLDSPGRNFYLKARMSVPLSLRRFVTGLGWTLTSGASQSSSLVLSHVMRLPPGCGPFCLQKVEYTLGEESETPGQRLFSFEELRRQLEKLLQEGSSNQRVFDWIEVCFSLRLVWRERRWYLMGATRMEPYRHNLELLSHLFLFLLHRPT